MTAILERRKRRLQLRRAANRSVSAGLEEWLDGDEPTTLGTLNHAFGEKLLAAGCLTLMAPSALPIPTGGATHVFDVFAIVFAVQMLLARRSVWLPAKWSKREMGIKTQKAFRMLIRFVKQCERISRPRLARTVSSRIVGVVAGAAMVLFIVAAFFSPPFSGLDTLPSLGVVLLSLGILMEDALFAIVGFVTGSVGIGLTVFFALQASSLIAG
ncbi:MAG: exopolysaccharide biosynthesis protein [Aquihabitans sp.]